MGKAKEKELPKGFTCECGAEHVYPAYVYAHWSDALTHTCGECQRVHQVFRGRATLDEKKKTKTKRK